MIWPVVSPHEDGIYPQGDGYLKDNIPRTFRLLFSPASSHPSFAHSYSQRPSILRNTHQSQISKQPQLITNTSKSSCLTTTPTRAPAPTARATTTAPETTAAVPPTPTRTTTPTPMDRTTTPTPMEAPTTTTARVAQPTLLPAETPTPLPLTARSKLEMGIWN